MDMYAPGGRGARHGDPRATVPHRGDAAPLDATFRFAVRPCDPPERMTNTLEKRLARAIPSPEVELDFESPWQLLVATILAAQSTDRTINRVTPALFARWPTPQSLAKAPRSEVEDMVKATGFFRNKAKAIQGAAAAIVALHGGEVPRTMEALVELPGVARKTANVVLGCAFGLPSGIVVDTHVGRVARRLALTGEDDPVKVERDLCRVFPRRSWIAVSHRLVLHGRHLCTSKSPACAACPVNEVCPSAAEAPIRSWTARADAEAGTVAASSIRLRRSPPPAEA